MFLTNGTIKLHYLKIGDHDGGVPMVLLPGLTANAHAFEGLIAAGLADDRVVYALDFRGRGLSDKPASGYSMDEYASDVLALLDAEELDSAVIVGHSFGALIGMVLAAKWPERVEKFVIIDSSHLLISERTAQLIKSSLDRLGKRYSSLEAYLEVMKQMPYLHGFWDMSVEAYFRGDVQIFENGSVQPQTPPDVIVQTIDAEFVEDWDGFVQQIEQPCLLIHARGGYVSAEPILPQAMADETVSLLQNCDYRPMAANHITMLFGENALELVEIIATWRADEPSARH
jgi:pimeloyl-ACP methyl ester carboxylesterase